MTTKRKRKSSSPLIDFVSTSAWAMHRPVLDKMLAIVGRHLDGEKLSADAVAAVVAQRDEEHDSEPEAYVRDGVAVVPIAGVLSKRARMVNGVSQPQGSSVERISRDLQAALANDQVESILLDIDSPGGSVDGIDGLAAEIAAADEQKPVTAFANGQANSAAYYLASQARKVVVSSDADLGSIGVYAVAEDWSRRAKNMGVDVHVVRAGKHKGAGVPGAPISPDTLATWQDNADAYYGLFVDAVARGREMPRDQVLQLADGRTWVGQQAVDIGLADAVGTLDGLIARMGRNSSGRGAGASARSSVAVAGDPLPAPHADSEQPAEKIMGSPNGATPTTGGAPPATVATVAPLTLEALRSQHPDLVATIAAEGHTKGTAEERARATEILETIHDAHREVAIKSIRDGLSAKDAVKLAYVDGRRMKDAMTEKYNQMASAPVGTSPVDPAKPAAPAATAPKTDAERWQAEYDAMGQDERREFGSLDLFVAWKKANVANAVRIVGRRGGN